MANTDTTEAFTHTESCVEHLMGVAFMRTASNSNVSTVPIELVLGCADALREAASKRS